MIDRNLTADRIITLLTTRYFTMGRAGRQQFTKNLFIQIYFTFNQSITMILSLGMLVGIFIALQAGYSAFLFGGQKQIGSLLVLLVFREIAPLATLLLIIARSVTAVAAEIASMKVGWEIAALNVLGINTYDYLWGPRIVSANISLFAMSLLFFISAAFGSWLGGNLVGYFPASQVVDSIAQALSITDIAMFILKSTVPGGIVFYIACRKASSIRTSRHEVPQATNKAVVDALIISMGFQFFISAAYYIVVGF